MKTTLTIILILFKLSSYGQDAIIDKCNLFISNNQLDSAKNILTFAINNNPDNLNYQAKLGYVYMSIDSIDSADKILSEVSSKDSSNQLANTYLGILKFKQRQYRNAISYSLKSINLSSKNTNKDYYTLQYIIGYSYHYLLSLEGLTYTEVDNMIYSLEEYIKSPTANEPKKIKKYIEKIKKNRPPSYVKKWQTMD